MKIATWNIAGGHTVKSASHFDYNEEDVAYFARHLAETESDIICLQETHLNTDRSIAREIADKLGGYRCFETSVSKSHIDDDYQLGMAILSKIGLSNPENILFPKPDFDLYFKDGRPAEKHDKALQKATANGVNIANMQLLPIMVFGYTYLEGEGKKLAYIIDRLMTENLNPPVILCGDFGMSVKYAETFPELFEKLKLQNSLPDVPTYHIPHELAKINAPDRIYYSTDTLEVIDSGVIVTETDHYLCWSEIGLKN
jgi:endonuclease/exonuclease/phosphatase family metal-dependent hydrolase